MMTPDQEQVVTYKVAEFIHSQRHRSQKTLFCKSDLHWAEDIVRIVLDQDNEDSQRS